MTITTIKQLAVAAVASGEKLFAVPEYLACQKHPDSPYRVVSTKPRARCEQCRIEAYALISDNYYHKRKHKGQCETVYVPLIKSDAMVMTEDITIKEQAALARSQGYMYFIPTPGHGCRKHTGGAYLTSNRLCCECHSFNHNRSNKNKIGVRHVETMRFSPPTLSSMCRW